MVFEFLSKFLSKVGCCRRRQSLSVATVEELRQQQFIAQEHQSNQEYILQRRRRRHSPQPRKMVANMNTPCLTEYEVDSLEYVEQRAQFQCPDGTVKDICWDSERHQVVILNGRYETHYMVDCSNTDIQGQDLTLKDVLDVMGYNMRDYTVENLTMYDAELGLQNALDTPVQNLPLMQFDIVMRPAPQC